MAKAAPDGQQVNIPALLIIAMEGRRVVERANYWILVCVSHVEDRQIRSPDFNVTTRHLSSFGFARDESFEHTSEKNF